MFDLRTDDIERLDHESLRILDAIGVRVDDERLRRDALAAGAKPGRGSDWIRLPPEMVREYVAMAPPAARFADCMGQVTSLGPGRMPTFWTGAALEYVRGKKSHPIGTSELAEFARIADSLDTVFAVTGTSLVDIPPTARDFVGFRILAENTRKHLRPLLFTPNGVPPILEMAEVIADGRSLEQCPLVSFGYSCLSPLHWSQIAVDLWRTSSGRKLPVMVNGEPIAGATAPVTLAGSIALGNAEILAGVVLLQILEPGRPIVHNLGFAHSMDMRTAACLAGSAECALMAYAGAKLAAYYGLPCASWMGSDSFLDDQQAAMEKMLTGFAHVLAGVNIIWGMGQLQSQKALSPVQLVMDDEVARALLRCRRGFDVSDETVAHEVIREVLEQDHEFLAHEHTLSHHRAELSESPLLARTQRELWEAQGATSLAERAAAHVEEILAEPAPCHLSDLQRRDLLAIERRAMERGQ